MTRSPLFARSALALAALLAVAGPVAAQPADLKPHEKQLFDTVNGTAEVVKAMAEQVKGLKEKAAKDKDRLDRLDELASTLTETAAGLKKLEVLVGELAQKPPVDGIRFGEKEFQTVQAELADLGRRLIDVEDGLKVVKAPGKLPKSDDEFLGRPMPYRRVAEPVARAAVAAAAAVIERQRSETFQVAVFPFGDAKREIGVRLADPVVALQGALIDELKKRAGGKFIVLDQEGLRNAVGKEYVGDASPFAPPAVANRLRKIKVDAAIVGTFFEDKGVSAMVVFADGTFVHAAGGLPEAPGPEFGAAQCSGRFNVHLLLKDPRQRDGWRRLEYVTAKFDSDSDYRNILFVELPDDLDVGTEAAQFKIRIQNRGEPALFQMRNAQGQIGPNPRDKDRLFGVAVRCDGVDSFYHRTADGKGIAPKLVEPDGARKWVLSGPGKVVVPQKGAPGGFVLQPPRPGQADHSALDVVGFQTGDDTARAFVFGSVRDSVAGLAGGSATVGLITVTFYAQKRSDDGALVRVTKTPIGPPNVGIMPGKAVPNLTFEIAPEWYPFAEETWHIFYRKKKAIPIPEKDRIPVSK